MLLRNGFLLLLFGLTIPAFAARAEDYEYPEWALCQSDDDCVTVGSNCEWFVVNKDHKSLAEQYLARPHKIECDPKSQMPHSVKCQAQKTGCKDWLGRIRPDATCVIRVCTPIND